MGLRVLVESREYEQVLPLPAFLALVLAAAARGRDIRKRNSEWVDKQHAAVAIYPVPCSYSFDQCVDCLVGAALRPEGILRL